MLIQLPHYEETKIGRKERESNMHRESVWEEEKSFILNVNSVNNDYLIFKLFIAMLSLNFVWFLYCTCEIDFSY